MIRKNTTTTPGRFKIVGSILIFGIMVSVLFMLAGQGWSAGNESTTLYVAAGGECLGAEPCFDNIQQAVDSAADRATIKIAQGEYTGSGSQVVSISKAITLTGGFTVSDWSRSNPIAYPTILDAEHAAGRRVLAINGAGVPTITISGLTIQDGYAQYSKGGGVYILGGTVDLIENAIKGNSADHGGGVYIANGQVSLSDNAFLENSASLDGGGLCIGGGTIYLEGNILTGNTAGRNGGGFSMFAGSVEQEGNTFKSNSANSGGGLAIAGGKLTGGNDIIVNNISPWDGVYVAGGSLTALNWTMVGNSGYALTTYGGSARLTNTLVVSHTLAGFWGQDILAETTLFYGNGTDCGGEAVCTNNLTGDPDFIAPESGNYHIGPSSAARDAGISTEVVKDVDGQIRPTVDGCDVGADEYTGTFQVFFPFVIREEPPVTPGDPQPFMVPKKKSGTPPIDFESIEEDYTSEGYGLEFAKVGFHVAVGGNRNGFGTYLQTLANEGVPVMVKSVNDYGAILEALSYSEDNIVVFRMEGGALENPDYSLSASQSANEHWARIKAALPPEFDKRTWLEVMNEPDKTRSDWLGNFAYYIGQKALVEGYKFAAFSFSTGEPEPAHWETAGMLKYLRLAAQYPDRLAVALHEYSLEAEQTQYTSMPVTNGYPYLVGRFQALFDICDEHNISRPTILITEWGWEYNDVPSASVAIEDIAWASWLYSAYPQVLGAAIWYLGPGFDNIANQAQKLISPVTEYARSHYFKVGLLEDDIDQSLFLPAGRSMEEPVNVYKKDQIPYQ